MNREMHPTTLTLDEPSPRNVNIYLKICLQILIHLERVLSYETIGIPCCAVIKK